MLDPSDLDSRPTAAEPASDGAHPARHGEL